MMATGLRFDTFYSDGSGIEKSVRYERLKDGGAGEVVIEHVSDVRFPVESLPWLIDALLRIHSEIESGGTP